MKRNIILVGLILIILAILVSGCQSPLHFEGLYRANGTGVFDYLRFYDDGTVLSTVSGGGSREVARWCDKDNIFAKGYYKIDGSQIKFTIVDNYNTIDYYGNITRKKLKLTASNRITGKIINQNYQYIPLLLTKDYSDNRINLAELLAPEKKYVFVQEVKQDIDNDGKIERIIFEDEKQNHNQHSNEYCRIVIYNSHNYRVFDSERAELGIRGTQFKDTADLIKIEDNNKNGIPELYLQEKGSGNATGRLVIIESDQTNYHVVFNNNLENYQFNDVDNDGKLELSGDTGSAVWELLYYMDKTVYKQKGSKYIPSYELTWLMVDNEQSKTNEEFANHPNFDNLLKLIALDAVLGLKDEGMALIKQNIELKKDLANVATFKNITGSFEKKLQKYQTYWSHFKASSEWFTITDQINDLYQQKRYSDALELATKSVVTAKEVFGADQINTVISLQNLAVLKVYTGKVNEATALIKDASTIIEKMTPIELKAYWDEPYRNLWCDNDFKPANVYLGMKEADIVKVMGNPIETKAGILHGWANLPESSFKDFLYKGLTARLVQTDKNEGFKVQQRILVKSPRYSTFRGIKVGDSYQKVLLTYGEPTFQNQNEIEYQIMYVEGLSNYWKHLTFRLNPKGNVDTVIIGPVYD